MNTCQELEGSIKLQPNRKKRRGWFRRRCKDLWNRNGREYSNHGIHHHHSSRCRRRRHRHYYSGITQQPARWTNKQETSQSQRGKMGKALFELRGHYWQISKQVLKHFWIVMLQQKSTLFGQDVIAHADLRLLLNPIPETIIWD